MIRIVLQSVLLFLLPFFLYFLFWFLMQRGRGLIDSTPWFWLSVGGLAFAVGGLVALTFMGSGDPLGIYVPPHMGEGGVIVPGRVRPLDGG
jgi:hypothetical protein